MLLRCWYMSLKLVWMWSPFLENRGTALGRPPPWGEGFATWPPLTRGLHGSGAHWQRGPRGVQPPHEVGLSSPAASGPTGHTPTRERPESRCVAHRGVMSAVAPAESTPPRCHLGAQRHWTSRPRLLCEPRVADAATSPSLSP